MKNTETSRWRQDSSRKEIVNARWKFLAEALFAKKLRRSKKVEPPKNDLNYFQLFSVSAEPEKGAGANDAVWYRYHANVNGTPRSVRIRHCPRNFTIEELAGFNNTGNVRVWPSEEILAYVAAKREHFFRGKTVLEVGGGMSCLAGILLAQSVDCRSIHVTDGNATAVRNVREILRQNSASRCPLSCDVLVWQDYSRHSDTYDVILAADCLFFDDCRADLIRLMDALLKPNGTILIMAPKRGDTLQRFVNLARDFGLACSLHRYYDDVVWSQRAKLQERRDYNEDLHYPLLLVVEKCADNVSRRISS